MNDFLKRVAFVVLATSFLFLPTATANAMTEKQVNTEITQINKRIKADRKKLKQAQIDDWNKQQQYTALAQAYVYCPNPFIIQMKVGVNKYIYLHISDTTDLRINENKGSTNTVEGYVIISEKNYDFNGTECKEAKAVVLPHQAADINARITDNTLRKQSLKRSKKETITLASTYTVGVGQSLTLTPVFKYNTSDINKITWKSSNSKVVKVSKKGNLLGIAPGTVTVSAKLSVTGKTYKTTVNVITG